ncbi:MAG: DUF6779 domain-containing protein [Pseudonocardiaceae bacterium]
MSVPDERPLPRGSSRVLMLGTVVLAAGAAAVLAAGAQDTRLLRLGLVAALWAALLGAFAAARMRREISSGASQADELQTVHQLELEREVGAWREHTLTVERDLRDLREQTEQVERREIAALRAELAAMRTNLEKLTDRDPLVERVALRAEPACVLPMPTHPHKFHDSPSPASALGATAKATPSRTAAGSSVQAPLRADRSPVGSALPTSEWPVNGRSETVLTPCEDPELRFGPARRYRPERDAHVRLPVEPASSGDRPWNPAVSSTPAWEPALTRWDDGISHPQTNGRHVAPSQESSGSNSNGSHSNGSHSNGSHSNGSHSNGSHSNGSHSNGSHSNGSHSNGSHSNGSHSNGSHSNGSHNNGSGTRRAAQETPVVEAQRSVNDLLAAHGVGSPPRRRRSREDGPQA